MFAENCDNLWKFNKSSANRLWKCLLGASDTIHQSGVDSAERSRSGTPRRCASSSRSRRPSGTRRCSTCQGCKIRSGRDRIIRIIAIRIWSKFCQKSSKFCSHSWNRSGKNPEKPPRGPQWKGRKSRKQYGPPAKKQPTRYGEPRLQEWSCREG